MMDEAVFFKHLKKKKMCAFGYAYCLCFNRPRSLDTTRVSPITLITSTYKMAVRAKARAVKCYKGQISQQRVAASFLSKYV